MCWHSNSPSLSCHHLFLAVRFCVHFFPFNSAPLLHLFTIYKLVATWTEQRGSKESFFTCCWFCFYWWIQMFIRYITQTQNMYKCINMTHDSIILRSNMLKLLVNTDIHKIYNTYTKHVQIYDTRFNQALSKMLKLSQFFERNPAPRFYCYFYSCYWTQTIIGRGWCQWTTISSAPSSHTFPPPHFVFPRQHRPWLGGSDVNEQCS